MSRSFKRFPGFSDNDHGKKYQKRQAARRARYNEDVPNGGAYKKLYEQWDICDYNCRYFEIRLLKEELESRPSLANSLPFYKWRMK